MCSAVDKSIEAEEPGRLAPLWALAGQTLPIEFAWTRGISIVNPPGISSPLATMWSVTAPGAACQLVSVRVRVGGE